MNASGAVPALDHRKLAAITLMGFASGLPLALSGGTLEAWCAVSGLSVKTIGMIKLVATAYVLKFLWAPLLDRYRLPMLSRRRGWMLAMQFGIAGTLILMAGLSPETSLTGIALLAVLLATLSATQDIAIDAYRADQLGAHERGLGAALGVGGYRVAMLTSSGLALVFAAHAGFRSTYLLMAALMLVGVAASLFAPEAESAPAPKNLARAFVEPLREFLARGNALWWLGLIATYKLANAYALSLSTTFLLRGGGYSLEAVGWANKVFALGASVAGVFVGGLLLVRWPLWRSLAVFGVLQTLANAGFLAVALGWRGMPALVTAIGAENFASGMGTAAFIALLMALCDRRYSATQFALFTALDAIGRVFIGPLAGASVERFGWDGYFWLSMLAGIPGLLILLILRPAFDSLNGKRAEG